MRSSTVLCIAALAAAAPSLAAPSSGFPPQYAKRGPAATSQGSGLWAPKYQPNRVVPGRYPGSWPPSGYRHYNTREDLDLQSGASFWGTVLRALPKVIKIAGTVLGKRDGQELSAREFEELFSRELEQVLTRGELEALIQARDDLESGAWSWGKFLSSVPGLVKTASTWFKREDLEALLQARDELESGAWNWGNFLKSVPSLVQTAGSWFKREELEEFLARAALEARSLSDLD